jgi:hypothetical protein
MKIYKIRGTNHIGSKAAIGSPRCYWHLVKWNLSLAWDTWYSKKRAIGKGQEEEAVCRDLRVLQGTPVHCV